MEKKGTTQKGREFSVLFPVKKGGPQPRAEKRGRDGVLKTGKREKDSLHALLFEKRTLSKILGNGKSQVFVPTKQGKDYLRGEGKREREKKK